MQRITSAFLGLLLVVAVIAMAPLAAQASDCMTYWKARHSFYVHKGICFQDPLARGYFGTSYCTQTVAPFTAEEEAQIKAFYDWETRNGCGNEIPSWSVAGLRAHDQVLRQAAAAAQNQTRPQQVQRVTPTPSPVPTPAISDHPRAAEIDRLIDAAFEARAGLRLSREGLRAKDGLRDQPMSVLYQSDQPVLAFRETWIGGAYHTELSFACGSDTTIEVTAVLKKIWRDEPSIDPNAQHGLLIRPYGVNRQIVVPAKYIGNVAGDASYVRFFGRVSAKDAFFRGLEDTSNFQIDIRENGRGLFAYNGGGKLDGAEMHLNPLLNRCSGYTPPAKPTPPPVSRWTPSDAEIAWALQEEVDARIAVIDRMREGCNTVGQTQDPIQALGCIMGTMSGMSSDTTSFKVNSVDLKKCWRMQNDQAWCNYRVDADVRGSSIGAALVQEANEFAKAVGSYGWGSFAMSGGRWRLEKVFKDCTVGETSMNCTYEVD